MCDEYAVALRDVCKHYGPKSGNGRKQILNNLSMLVPKGVMYVCVLVLVLVNFQSRNLELINCP